MSHCLPAIMGWYRLSRRRRNRGAKVKATLYLRFFRVYCEEVFTTKDTARRSRNQNEKSRIHHEGTKDTKVFVGCACAPVSLGIFRAKHVLSNVEGTPRPQRSEKNGADRIFGLSSFPFRTWRALRLGASQSPVFEYFRSLEKLRQLRKILCIAVQRI